MSQIEPKPPENGNGNVTGTGTGTGTEQNKEDCSPQLEQLNSIENKAYRRIWYSITALTVCVLGWALKFVYRIELDDTVLRILVILSALALVMVGYSLYKLGRAVEKIESGNSRLTGESVRKAGWGKATLSNIVAYNRRKRGIDMQNRIIRRKQQMLMRLEKARTVRELREKLTGKGKEKEKAKDKDS